MYRSSQQAVAYSSWACAGRRPIDSRETPSCRATAVTTEVRVGYFWNCSRTSPTHLERNGVPIIHGRLSIFPDLNSRGVIPGTVHLD